MLNLVVLVSLLVTPRDAGFQRVGGKYGVEVYRLMSSPVIELIAEGEIDAPPGTVRDTLLDYAAAPKLSERISESSVLVRGEHQLIVYQRLRLPVVTDRDYNLRVNWSASGSTQQIRFTVDNEHGRGGSRAAVRVTALLGGWDLAPIRNGQATCARYYVRIDMGGSIPRWLVSGGATKDLPRLFQGVRRQVRQLQIAATRQNQQF